MNSLLRKLSVGLVGEDRPPDKKMLLILFFFFENHESKFEKANLCLKRSVKTNTSF